MMCLQMQEPVHISCMLCTVTHKHTQSSSCVNLCPSYFVGCVCCHKISPNVGIFGILPIEHSVGWCTILLQIHFCNLKIISSLTFYMVHHQNRLPKGSNPLGFGFSPLQNPKQVICPLHTCSCLLCLIMGVFLQSPQHDLGHLSNHVA